MGQGHLSSGKGKGKVLTLGKLKFCFKSISFFQGTDNIYISK